MTRWRERLRSAQWPRPAPSDPGSGDRPQQELVTLRDSYLSGWFNRETGELFPGFPVGPSDTVADVGCGDGACISYCVLQGAEVCGIDIDEGALSGARERIAGRGGGVTLATGDAAEIPLPDDWASRVVCTEVLEHVPNVDRVLSELVRVLRPGGLLLVSVPDEVGEAVLARVADAAYFTAPNHIRVFAREEFRAAVEGHGLQVTSQRTDGFYWTIWWALFWETGQELGSVDHPLIHEWNRLWRDVVSRPEGHRLKEQLDSIAPKSQIIVARKPPCSEEKR